MRFLYVKLVGYAGLYNGSGLDSIEIDFTKCKNKITVISGPNGTGKSTIINALNILPDGNHNFLEGREASKTIKLMNEGNIYDIQITHPIDKNNNRTTTKATIQKNGIELNTSGNVSQYKDIVFSEFDMDSNYIELFKISSDKRGLSDKIPSERKKFMSSLISSLDVYNNIYKNLNKKANIFKSYINTLSSKIQNIGDEANLRQSLVALNNRETKIKDTITGMRDKIVELKTLIATEDPNGTMHTEFDFINNETVRINKELSTILNNNSEDSFFDDVVKKRIEVQEHQNHIIVLSERMQQTADEMTRCNNDLSKLEIRLAKLQGTIDNDLVNKIKFYKNKVYTIEDMFSKIGVTDVDSISADEITHTIDIIHTLLESIDNYLCNVDTTAYSYMEDYYGATSKLVQSITDYGKEIKDLEYDVSEWQRLLTATISNQRIVKVLADRPKNCKIDNCAFVNNALEIVKQYGDLDALEDKYTRKLDESKYDLNKATESKALMEEILSIVKQAEAIYQIIKMNTSMLKKFKACKVLIDEKVFIHKLSMFDEFNELRTMSDYHDIANEIINHKTYTKILTDLEADYKIYQSNESQIKEITADIEAIKTSKESLQTEQLKLIDERKQENEIISFLESRIELTERKNELESSLAELTKKKQEFEKKFSSSITNLQTIDQLQIDINNLSTELQPIEDSRRTIESQLILLDSYNKEYGEYKYKFDVVNKLRNYSSPTSDSIQALFMSIYMDKTLSMVNQLLGMMFNGNYRILEYVINDSEFRIPFIGNGLAVDDISSGSTSQKCMMGMIINLVLSSISSGKYNIVSLDEIDGGLDDANRYMFVDVLQKISEALNFEQIFIISHSVESALNNVDVVLLSNDQTYLDQFGNANIVYQK